MTGLGEIIRWYNNKRIQGIPDFVYNVLKHLTQAVESLYFKAAMSKYCICVLVFYMYERTYVCMYVHTYMCTCVYMYIAMVNFTVTVKQE